MYKNTIHQFVIKLKKMLFLKNIYFLFIIVISKKPIDFEKLRFIVGIHSDTNQAFKTYKSTKKIGILDTDVAHCTVIFFSVLYI